MSYETILYSVENGVATITLNRPETRNAMTSLMYKELRKALREAAADKSVRALILTGAGKGFCSGADLGEIAAATAEVSVGDILRSGLNPLIMSIRTLEKPVICALNGVAAGAGTSLALACDMRIASDQASFVFAAFVNIGIIPDGGLTYLLTNIVGANKALELALFADASNRLSADAAQELGIVNRVVNHDDLMSETRIIAEKLAQMPTRAIGWTKRALYNVPEKSLAEAMEYEAQIQNAAFRTKDHAEGVAAFIEKRKPIFTGE